MLLANGEDAALIDHTGSMFGGGPAHAHREQHQGCACGWYKVGHIRNRSRWMRLQPILRCGYFLSVSGEPWDISDYEQSFDPESAVLTTRVTAGGVVCDVESFLTENHLLVEHYRVREVPRRNIDVAFLPMNLPYTMTPRMVADVAVAMRPRILYPYHFGSTDTSELTQLLKDHPDIEVRMRNLA